MANSKARLRRPGERVRVLVVDDSAVIRSLVRKTLDSEPGIEVVGAVSNGSIALQRIPQLNPDVMTLDIEMPEMDGLETLRRAKALYPNLRVLMFSSQTERGAAATLEALRLGADDYISKAYNATSQEMSMARLREELPPRIRQFFEVSSQFVHAKSFEPARPADPIARRTTRTPKVVVIGVSTGGPAALRVILPFFPAGFPLPILVVQHMPPLFTRLLAEGLQPVCHLPVEEAVQGMAVLPGRIVIAPGDFHMRVTSAGDKVRICLDQSPQLNSCRPAVDALFASIADVYGGAAVAAVLTGMGQDGLRGAEALKAQGATILAQDEASSVVWGMPGAVVNANLADAVLSLDRIVPEIVRLSGGLTGI